jgi:hypothetical protein
MARVKSTIDLIMEKTKHLSLDPEEKAAFERQQLAQRIQAPLLRYLRGERDATNLADELDRLPAETAEEGKRLCLGLLMDSLSPFEDNQRILAAVRTLLGENERLAWEKAIAPLEARFRDERRKAREQAVERCREILAERGLAGPALLPRPDEEDPSWKEQEEQRVQAFRAMVRKALGDPQM